MTPKIFRIMLGITILLSIIGYIVEELTFPLLPIEVQNFVEEKDSIDLTVYDIATLTLLLPLLIFSIINLFELFKLKQRARRHATILTIISLPIYPLIGPYANLGYSQIFFDAYLALWGFLLGAMYYSDLKKYFDNQNKDCI